MNATIRSASKRYVIGISAMTVVALMFLSLLPAMAGPGPSGATVTGTVTDINDGEPIEGALVVISYHETEMSKVTGADGKYKFVNVPECYCLKKITATKDGYRSESVEVGVSGITVVDFELLFMELEPYNGTIEGTVTDNNDGTPMEGVHVELEYDETIRETYTDSDGKYRFDRVPECRCLKKVTATKEHFLPQSEEVTVQGVTVVDFALWIEEMHPNGGTLTGIVTDKETGKPIVGALVTLKHDGKVWTSRTDENGRYEMTGIPLCFCLKEVSVAADGYKGLETEVAVDETTVVDFSLEPKDGGNLPDLRLERRIVIGFPGVEDIPGGVREPSRILNGIVGASPVVLATGLYDHVARI